MLSKDDAAKLALSGYSKSDIEALGFSFSANTNESDKPDTNTNTNESDKPDTNTNTNESNKPDTIKNESDKTDSAAAIEALTKTVGELSATVKAMQEANIKGARGKGTNDNNAQSASDVVKNFIKNM